MTCVGNECWKVLKCVQEAGLLRALSLCVGELPHGSPKVLYELVLTQQRGPANHFKESYKVQYYKPTLRASGPSILLIF